MRNAKNRILVLGMIIGILGISACKKEEDDNTGLIAALAVLAANNNASSGPSTSLSMKNDEPVTTTHTYNVYPNNACSGTALSYGAVATGATGSAVDASALIGATQISVDTVGEGAACDHNLNFTVSNGAKILCTVTLSLACSNQ